MPNEIDYSLQELADLADVTSRTIRYYIAQGLLPSPDGTGPAARYGDGHLRRLRLVRQLQRQHMPLAEIRRRLEGLDDASVESLLATGEQSAGEPAGTTESAIDYIRTVLGRSSTFAATQPTPVRPTMRRPIAPAVASMAMKRARSGALDMPDFLADEMAEPAPPPMAQTAPPAPAPAPAQTPDRSQWDRVTLAPDIELHVRRPLSRLQNKRVDRLIVIARQLLEEE